LGYGQGVARQRDPDALFAAALAGDRVSIGRLLSLIEGPGSGADHVDELILAHCSAGSAGSAGSVGLNDSNDSVDSLPPPARWLLGVTGAPGAGKSTLTDFIVESLRQPGPGLSGLSGPGLTHAVCAPMRVAVLAVDPSSPKTGGALLGDRIRMGRNCDDEGVFIRSIATRGAAGGLAACVPVAARLLHALGFDCVIVETVGVGQVELDVAALADTVLVVMNPGWGDDVQAVKAGLMEIADVFVVNKIDRPGAAETIADIESMLTLSHRSDSWVPPVHGTCAIDGSGVAEMVQSLRAHSLLEGVSLVKVRREIESRLVVEMLQRVRGLLDGDEAVRVMQQVAAGDITVATAVAQLREAQPRAAKLQGRFSSYVQH
jgi:LAO/AO transport system kinase